MRTLVLLGSLAALCAAGCGTSAEREAGPARTEPPAAVVRAGYRAAGSSAESPASWRHLVLDAPLSAAPPDARRDLERALDAVTGSPAPPPAAPRAPAVRTYEIALGRRSPDHVSIEDTGLAGPAVAVAAVEGRQARAAVDAPALLEHLRGESLRALRASMSPPRKPLEWSHAALAGFLGSRAAGKDGERTLRQELLAALLANPEPSPLAEVLIEKASAFDPSELEPLLAHDSIPPRLLGLTGAAARGDAKALGEILTLSLEYYEGGPLFDRALRVLFPRPSNPGLHARHPASGRGPARAGFIREVHAGLGHASFRDTKGWALER